MGNTRELVEANTSPFWILRWSGESCDLLLAKEGEHISLSFSDMMTEGRRQISILVREEVVDESAHPGTSHRVVKDELSFAVAVQRRFARKGYPDRTGIVPESESVPPNIYELHFLHETGKHVATLYHQPVK